MTVYFLVVAVVVVFLLCRRWQQARNIPAWKALLVMVGILVVINVIVFGLEHLLTVTLAPD